MKIRFLVGLVIAAALVVVPARAADTPEDLAQKAAESWLKLTDAGDGGTSWDQAARRLKGKVTKAQWTKSLAGARSLLGKVISRKMTSRKYEEKLPEGPAANHVTIRYETVFEKKASAVEIITPMLDPDGVWRVAGYVVEPGPDY